MTMNPIIVQVADTIVQRSIQSRKEYLANLEIQQNKGKQRAVLACGNLAHTVAASSSKDKTAILDFTKTNVAIITAYNDMVSAHQPYRDYPEIIKQAVS